MGSHTTQQSRLPRILALDGGGTRGLSTLYTLQFIMQGVEDAEASSTPRPLRPCDYFDLIAGTSSGGLIAIMLGVLRMTVPQCIEEWENLAASIFPKRKSKMRQLVVSSVGKSLYSEKPLELAIKGLVKKYMGDRAGPDNDPLLADKKLPGCKVFVVTTSQELGVPTLLRNYAASWSMAPEVTVCQAARATSAAPTFLSPMLINGIKYVDGALSYNNPIFMAREEAQHLWGGQKMGCIISIGTGMTTPKDAGQSLSRLVRFAVDKMTKSAETARAFETEMQQNNGGFEQKIYYRFNVPRGLEGIEINEVSKAPRVLAATMNYLNENWAKRDTCVAGLIGKQALKEEENPNAARIWDVPHMDNQHFTGRHELLDSIREHLNEKGTRLLLWGMAGVGKTEIARKYAYLTRQRYSTTSWISAERQSSLENGLRKLPRPVRGKKSLLIIDDIDTGNDGIMSCLHEGLPCSDDFDVLLTARSDSSSKLMSEALEIDCLRMNEAVDLLKRLTPNRSSCINEDEVAKQICYHLGNLPLAVSQCAGYINTTRTSFQDYPEDPEEFLSRTLGDSPFVRRLNASKKQILSTFEIIWQHLSREDTAARDLMCLFGLLTREVMIDMILAGLTEHNKWFPTGEYRIGRPYYVLPSLEAATAAPHLLEEMIGILCDLNMAKRSGNSLTIHAVVHWYVGWKLAQENEKSYQCRLQAMSILQHAQNLGETQGKVHLSSDPFESSVWSQASRILVTSGRRDLSSFKNQAILHPDLFREFTRLLLYIPGLFTAIDCCQGGNRWFASEQDFSSFDDFTASKLKSSTSKLETKATEETMIWGSQKRKVRGLVERLVSECGDPSLWLEAVAVDSRRLFAVYKQQGKDFFLHRNSYSYLGTTFAAQRSRWTAFGYPFLSRVTYSMWTLEKEAIYSWSHIISNDVSNDVFTNVSNNVATVRNCCSDKTCAATKVPWVEISWSATTGECHDGHCRNCLEHGEYNKGSGAEKLANFMKIGWLPEQVQMKTALDVVVAVTISLAKALFFLTFMGEIPGYGNFDSICSEHLKAAFTLLVSPAGMWSIEDGFIFYPLRDLCSLPKREAPATNKLLDCLLTVACCGEALTPVNSPAIANLCGVWIMSVWLTKGQAKALEFADTVVHRILQPLSKIKRRFEDTSVVMAIWLTLKPSTKANNSGRSLDNLRITMYDLDPATHLGRLTKIIRECPELKDKKLVREPYYWLPLDHHDADSSEEVFLVTFKSRYHFIYTVEKSPAFGHLLYLFQGETIQDLKRIISSAWPGHRCGKSEEDDCEIEDCGNDGPEKDDREIDNPQNNDAQNYETHNDDGLSPRQHISMPLRGKRALEDTTALCDHSKSAECRYIVDLRHKPPFPQFGIEGDPDAISHGVRAPPRLLSGNEDASNATKEGSYVRIHVL